jgi:hypothetical protein
MLKRRFTLSLITLAAVLALTIAPARAEPLTQLCQHFVQASQPYTQTAKQAGCYTNMPFWQANPTALHKWCLNTDAEQLTGDVLQFQTIDRLDDSQALHNKSHFIEAVLKQRQFEWDECVNTKFLDSLKKGDYQSVPQWLKWGANPDYVPYDPNDHSNIFYYFICNGIPQGKTAGFIKTLGLLLKKPVNMGLSPTNGGSGTALSCAAMLGNAQALELMLKAGKIEGSGLNNSGENYNDWDLPLISAIAFGKDLASVKLLLKYGADPNFSYEKANKPLLVAIQHNQLAMAHALLEAGASVKGGDAGECQGKLPLQYAQALKGVAPRQKQRLIQRIQQLMQMPSNACP